MDLRLDKMARYIDDLRKTKIEVDGKVVEYPMWKRLKDLCETEEFKEDEKKSNSSSSFRKNLINYTIYLVLRNVKQLDIILLIF